MIEGKINKMLFTCDKCEKDVLFPRHEVKNIMKVYSEAVIDAESELWIVQKGGDYCSQKCHDTDDNNIMNKLFPGAKV